MEEHVNNDLVKLIDTGEGRKLVKPEKEEDYHEKVFQNVMRILTKDIQE